MQLCGAELGRTPLFEPVLDHDPIVDSGGGPDVASAVSNPHPQKTSSNLKFDRVRSSPR